MSHVIKVNNQWLGYSNNLVDSIDYANTFDTEEDAQDRADRYNVDFGVNASTPAQVEKIND